MSASGRWRPKPDLATIESLSRPLMHIALSIILLSSISSSAIAATGTEEISPGAAPQVAVTGTKDPDWRPYRKMLDGINAFDHYHSLAPAAELKFVLRPQQPNPTIVDLKLRIVGDTVNIEVPIAADYTFSVPRDESANKEDADMRLSTKKGLFRWRPDIHTTGLPAGTRRLGDLRLECEVRWAIDKFDASFVQVAYLAALGGACHTSRSRIFYTTEFPIASVTLVAGSRHEKLPPERLDARDNSRYAPPLHDQSWPDDTLVEIERTNLNIEADKLAK